MQLKATSCFAIAIIICLVKINNIRRIYEFLMKKKYIATLLLIFVFITLFLLIKLGNKEKNYLTDISLSTATDKKIEISYLEKTLTIDSDIKHSFTGVQQKDDKSIYYLDCNVENYKCDAYILTVDNLGNKAIELLFTTDRLNFKEYNISYVWVPNTDTLYFLNPTNLIAAGKEKVEIIYSWHILRDNTISSKIRCDNLYLNKDNDTLFFCRSAPNGLDVTSIYGKLYSLSIPTHEIIQYYNNEHIEVKKIFQSAENNISFLVSTTSELSYIEYALHSSNYNYLTLPVEDKEYTVLGEIKQSKVDKNFVKFIFFSLRGLDNQNIIVDIKNFEVVTEISNEILFE